MFKKQEQKIRKREKMAKLNLLMELRDKALTMSREAGGEWTSTDENERSEKCVIPETLNEAFKVGLKIGASEGILDFARYLGDIIDQYLKEEA